MKPAIKIENLSKQYRLGLVGTGTISHDLRRWWHLTRGKEDPYIKIGEKNERPTKGLSEYVWALKDINLEVMPGEVLGIIGKNGAGKSTLLKILSKVTGPTTGVITYNGRIGSLLEVGTGFHPELTGRENIYLNGAILGMRKKEIDKKFDEIVDFSGVERYIDTPTKRYSSGMTVRLGFAVAAFLEPEILVVDEVLAVGDAEFQKKALGKMQDVSNEQGRTVLFVSHNMTSIGNLCNKIILLQDGKILKTGKTNEVINFYLQNNNKSDSHIEWKKKDYAPGTEEIKILEAFIDKNNEILFMTSEFSICVKILIVNPVRNLNVTFHLLNENDIIAFGAGNGFSENYFEVGEYLFSYKVPSNLMNAGNYRINLIFAINGKMVFKEMNVISFEIIDNTIRKGWHGKLAGIVRPELEYEITKVSKIT